jgi:LysM repeat protein
MPLSSSSPYSPREDDRSPRRAGDPSDRDRLIPFPGGDNLQRRRRRVTEQRDQERTTSRPRRARRRRNSAPWLQRNALSIAALSFLVALLGLGFGVVQLLTRTEPSPALQPVNAPEQATTLSVASVGTATTMGAIAGVVNTTAPLGTAGNPAIQSTARVIEANYTVVSGDTLARIAANYNTTVERIQAFNANLTDPRTLRTGARLVIPPPL